MMYNSAELQALLDKRLKDGGLGAYHKLCKDALNEEVKKMIAQRKKDGLGDESIPLTVNPIQANQMMIRILETLPDAKATRLANAINQEIKENIEEKQQLYGKRYANRGLMDG